MVWSVIKILYTITISFKENLYQAYICKFYLFLLLKISYKQNFTLDSNIEKLKKLRNIVYRRRDHFLFYQTLVLISTWNNLLLQLWYYQLCLNMKCPYKIEITRNKILVKLMKKVSTSNHRNKHYKWSLWNNFSVSNTILIHFLW